MSTTFKKTNYKNNKRKYMKIRPFDFQKAQEYLNYGKISKHILENPVRYNKIAGKDFVIPKDAFWVDKKHKNGPEIHIVCKDATILIFNVYSKKLCTILFGRPGQILRYYDACGMVVPEYILEYARLNIINNRNML